MSINYTLLRKQANTLDELLDNEDVIATCGEQFIDVRLLHGIPNLIDYIRENRELSNLNEADRSDISADIVNEENRFAHGARPQIST